MASSPESLPPYAELHCLSNFSFLRGASHPDELVQRAAQLGYSALALTDECSVAGVVRAHVAAKMHGLKLIIGAEFRLCDGPRLVLLAADREGYGHLSRLITQGRRAAEKGEYALRCADLTGGLDGCLALLLPSSETEPEVQSLHRLAAQFAERCWIAVERLLNGDRQWLQRCEALAAELRLPLVAAGNVHMHERRRRALQDTLTAIRLGCKVADLGLALHGNGERHLRPREHLARLYPPALLKETIRIADLCRFSLDSLRYEYPREVIPPGVSPGDHLRRLTEEGMRRRWPDGVSDKVRQQIEHELRLIAELRYEHYFLTVHDIVRFAREERGILCQGRGSAANSAVCYCLGITEVDPARMSLLFERFISRERNEPPDIDVDFEHERREEVIQYIYDKYGRDRAALAATVITYRARSAVRDVGKALGFEPAQIDRMAKSLAWVDGDSCHSRGSGNPVLSTGSDAMRRWLELAGQLIGFPRHLSQHVGGFVISDGPLCRLVPIENAAMADRTVIQWDKDDLEALGLMKVDVLGLGILTALHRALDLVNGYRDAGLTMANIPPEDPETYRMVQRADTVGVFQIESRAQMAMLPRLKPENFFDLVIEIALVRPGPIQGDMVHPYLRRRQGLEPIDYPSEDVRKVLERTLGVPIFQEQVMQLAMVAAGFTPGEADQLRRSMASWHRRGGLAPFQQKLRGGMQARGYDDEFAQRICKQIEGFAEYGFPESHSASFALLAYVSAWLKRHEPAAFTAALINSQPMGFYAPAQLVQDARRHGVEVRAVDVRTSDWDCTLEASSSRLLKKPGSVTFLREWLASLPLALHRDQPPARTASPSEYLRHVSLAAARHPSGSGEAALYFAAESHRARLFQQLANDRPALRLGLRLVKGLSEAGAQRLVEARRAGPFIDVQDVLQRAGLSKGDLERLAAAGALAGLAGHRHLARWQALGARRESGLLEHMPITEGQPMLRPPTEGEDIVEDYTSLGLTLGRHPLALLRDRLKKLRYRDSRAIERLPHGRPARVAGLVITRQRPATASGVIFLTLEDEHGTINVVVWRDLADRAHAAVTGGRLLGVTGSIEKAEGVIHIVAAKIEDHTPLLGRLVTQSHDFH